MMLRIKLINQCFPKSNHELAMIPNGYVVCEDKTCRGAYTEIPEHFKNYELIDYGNQLIIPGMSDLHLHAPQYTSADMLWTWN